MSQPNTVRLRQLISPQTPVPPAPGRRAAALVLRLGCVALLAWIAAIHLHLWLEGYWQIPTDGPLFLLDATAGFVLAVVLLAWPRPLAGLAAAGYAAATLGALLISLTVGLFGFHESLSASFVTQSLAIETLTLTALLCWAALVATAPRPPAGPSPRITTRQKSGHNTARSYGRRGVGRGIKPAREAGMRPTMSHRSIGAVRADALFVSALQPSQNPGAWQVRQAVGAAVRRFGGRGCAGRVAQEFGEHPEAAAARMRWARQAAAAAFGRPGIRRPVTGRPRRHRLARAA